MSDRLTAPLPLQVGDDGVGKSYVTVFFAMAASSPLLMSVAISSSVGRKMMG
jgi:hypothetical protein